MAKRRTDKNSGGGEKQELLEQQELRDAKEEAAFQKLMKEVFGGMKGESGVMKDTTELLNREQHNHDDKQVAMYKQWERHVYHHIQEQVAKKLKKLTPDVISKKLRTLSPKLSLWIQGRISAPKMFNPFQHLSAGVHFQNHK